MKKILTVIGARPQFVKAAVVSRAIASSQGALEEVIVHTGQHYDSNMSDIFFDELEIPYPDYNLGVGGGTHGEMTGRQLEQVEKIMLAERPDWVLVYGDTNSTLAGALAAAKLNIKVAHVEAGLRSFNKRMPEEINRILTDHISSALFAPTETACLNLERDGVDKSLIFQVGDVMQDAALFYKDKAKSPAWFSERELVKDEYVLCTIHRAENTDSSERMHGIVQGLSIVESKIVLPLHPRTRVKLLEMGVEFPSNVVVCDPVGYLEMVWLEANCRCVVTDSGGVQKEAYFHGKPCVTLRDETEWTELVDSGWNILVGADSVKIAEAIRTCKRPAMTHDLYGFGDASRKIVERLMEL